ncbi:MAG TPA: MAPEG family protein [Caulobacteraceae bacterium]|nr:MAPEG family protein [Caulobacteraceae bacterium]
MDQDAFHAAAQAAALWTALLLLLLLALSLLVVRQRRRHAVPLGDEGIAELTRAIRAFGNAAEYAPAGMAGLLALAAVGAPPLAVHLAGVLLFGGRILHSIALSRTGGSSLLRSAGMTMTWVAYVFEVVALLIFAVV